jgi:hypothetical protein
MIHEGIKIKNGGFILGNGLPDEFYALANGNISLTIERNGGINSIKMWDIFYQNSKPYPDTCPTPPVISKSGNKCGIRPLYGPGIRFVSECHLENENMDRCFYHFPQSGELYPFGFKSHSIQSGFKLLYDMAIHDSSIVWQLKNNIPGRCTLKMFISKFHFPHGQMRSLKNFIAHEAVNPHSQSWRHDIKISDTPESFPFHESGKYDLAWMPDLTHIPDLFEMRGDMDFGYLKKAVHMIVKANQPLEIEETKDMYILKIKWNADVPEDNIAICLALGDDKERILEKVETILLNPENIINDKILRNAEISNSVMKLNISSMPEASSFASAIIPFEKAMIVAETDSEACIRPAIDKYGFMPLWDQIWPAKAFIASGDFKTARKLLNYMLTLPGSEQLFMNNLFLIISIEELLIFTEDNGYLADIWSTLKRMFLLMDKNTDTETGLLEFKSTCGADDPRELGLDGMILPSCFNGLWYGVCRAIENMAIIMEDTAIAEKANFTVNKIFKNYMRVFFCQDKGYLSVAAEACTSRQSPVCQNVSTLGMDCPYGEYLLHSKITEIAAYQANMLYHPLGRTSVALNSQAYESWKNAYMFQHLSHEAKTARAAGRGEETRRITQTYMNIFRKTLTGIETYNLNGCEKDITQRADWQAFGARGAYGALIEGVAGIQWDMGGFQYVPCHLSGDISISDFKFKNSIWNIKIHGDGDYCNDMILDGKALPGTMKIPALYLNDGKTHNLEIERVKTPFENPILLSALNASVADIESTENKLVFCIKNETHSTLKIYSPTKPLVKIHGIETAFEWDDKKSTLWLDCIIKKNSKITIMI